MFWAVSLAALLMWVCGVLTTVVRAKLVGFIFWWTRCTTFVPVLSVCQGTSVLTHSILVGFTSFVGILDGRHFALNRVQCSLRACTTYSINHENALGLVAVKGAHDLALFEYSSVYVNKSLRCVGKELHWAVNIIVERDSNGYFPCQHLVDDVIVNVLDFTHLLR
jgi:hypothetical protein